MLKPELKCRSVELIEETYENDSLSDFIADNIIVS